MNFPRVSSSAVISSECVSVGDVRQGCRWCRGCVGVGDRVVGCSICKNCSTIAIQSLGAEVGYKVHQVVGVLVSLRFAELIRGFHFYQFADLWACDFDGGTLAIMQSVPVDYSYSACYGSVKNYFEKVLTVTLEDFFKGLFGYNPYKLLRTCFGSLNEEAALQVAAIAGNALIALSVRRRKRGLTSQKVSDALAVECSQNAQCRYLQKIFWTATGWKLEVPGAYSSKLFAAMVFLDIREDFYSYFMFGQQKVVLRTSTFDPQFFLFRGFPWEASEVELRCPELAGFLRVVDFVPSTKVVGIFEFNFDTLEFDVDKNNYVKLVGYANDLLRYLLVVVAISGKCDLVEFLKKLTVLTSTAYLNSKFTRRVILRKEEATVGREFWLLNLLLLFENRWFEAVYDIVADLFNDVGISVFEQDERIIVERMKRFVCSRL